MAPLFPPTPPTLQELARRRVKEWIATTGTTQTTICSVIGRNQPWLSRFLSGDIDADVDTLAKLASAFDQTLFGLLAVPSDPEEANVILLYRNLRPEGRKAALAILQEMGRARAPGRPRR